MANKTMSKDGRIWLSHTSIELCGRCPRCFWLQMKKGIRQPEGIVSRLANRFDKILKSYFDLYRNEDCLPPMVESGLEGKLQNPFVETYFVRVNEKYGFLGKLDECLVATDAKFIPVDFKTSSTDPREKEILPAYYSQIDDYLYILQENRRKTKDYGYLVYVYPEHSKDLHKGCPMLIHIQKLKGDPQNSIKRIEKAIKVLESAMPKPSDDCNFCTWHKKVDGEVNEGIKFLSIEYNKTMPLEALKDITH